MKTISLFISLFVLSVTINAQEKAGTFFTESELVLKTTSGDISGTLTVTNKSKKSPLVIIIAGSGPTDRNCNSPMGIKTDAYKMISSELAGKGISSLRYDKRGIAKSKSAMTSEMDLRFDTYIGDLEEWIKVLKEDRRFSKIYLCGHSEGSLIGMVASGETKTAGFISISGAGKPADRILKEQLKGKISQQLYDESVRTIDSLKAGYLVTKVNPMLFTLFRPGVQPYMISWMKYDPAREIQKLKIPVLILQGTTDLQITVDDARLLAAAKPEAKLLIIENMNHVLKESDSDRQRNMATYSNPDLPLKPELIEALVKFIDSK
jgi:pimeloyl-ACP methyl ester carboxylesterase